MKTCSKVFSGITLLIKIECQSCFDFMLMRSVNLCLFRGVLRMRMGEWAAFKLYIPLGVAKLFEPCEHTSVRSETRKASSV